MSSWVCIILVLRSDRYHSGFALLLSHCLIVGKVESCLYLAITKQDHVLSSLIYYIDL